MQFLIKARDARSSLDKRMAVREKHLANMAKIRDKVICAGGLLDDEGKMCGSALIMEFDNEEELNSYLKTEPYVEAGVWETIEVDRMNVVVLSSR